MLPEKQEISQDVNQLLMDWDFLVSLQIALIKIQKTVRYLSFREILPADLLKLQEVVLLRLFSHLEEKFLMLKKPEWTEFTVMQKLRP